MTISLIGATLAFMQRRAPLFCSVALVTWAWTYAPAANDMNRQTTELRALSALEPIDAHTHITVSDPAVTSMLEGLDLHVLDIVVPDDKDPVRTSLDEQRAEVFAFMHSAHGRATVCTSFNPFLFSTATFQRDAIAKLNDDFARGAVAVKVWKNVGMELKDSVGHYVLIDDPRLEPIFQDIATNHKTLIAHQAEPDVAWGPPDPKAIDNSYYVDHPEWNMQKRPDAPKKATVLASRDHLLAENSDLRVIGAHLGSMEGDVDLVAERLDRYPNFAVDLAARVPHLGVQPSAKVRAFLIKYQDRIIYGTDTELHKGDDVTSTIQDWKAQLAAEWRYFSTSDHFTYEGQAIEGVNLPPAVLHKLYHDNAIRWISGVVQGRQ